jgi:predicted MFS family arabinose efflux permease
MYHRKLKLGYFCLTWINSYATSYYFNYVFFHARQDLGFSSRENLALAALNGLIYVFMALLGGRFAQRHGYFVALRIGFGGMAAALALGSFWPGALGQVIVMALWTVAISFTWPTLEALASEGENRAGLVMMVGVYNAVWASASALAYFTGGAVFEHLGPSSLFWLPAGLHVGQWVLLEYLSRRAGTWTEPHAKSPAMEPQTSATPPAQASAFVRMSWIANPFAYVAMNTVIPMLPELAARLGLSTTLAGFVGSVWLFARLMSFVALWRWEGWHYHFGWLVGAYGLMLACFAALLLVANLGVLIVAQVGFGLAAGLLYYSSLFYSMDTSDTKGEHGGVHEAAIGLGNFAGPAVGAAALQFAPGRLNAGTWAVSLVLLLGLAALLFVRKRRRA